MFDAHPPIPRKTEASPAPWTAEPTGRRSGAVCISDANGDLIGWATDCAGHTTETAAPDRRPPAVTLRNAHRMARSAAMIDVLAAIVAQVPSVLRQVAGDGGVTHGAFLHTIARAQVLVDADRAMAIVAAECVQVPL